MANFQFIKNCLSVIALLVSGASGDSVFDKLSSFAGDLSILHGWKSIANSAQNLRTEIKNDASCAACAAGMAIVQERLNEGATEAQMLDEIIHVCQTLNLLSTDAVCRGTVTNVGHDLYYILKARPDRSPETICSLFLQNLECFLSDVGLEFDLNLDLGKPVSDLVQMPFYNNYQYQPMKMLQLTDLHIDPEYTVGANAKCGDIMCCMAENGMATDPANGAGYWGDYRDCNLPYWTFDATLRQIAANHPDINYIIFTGDFVPHNFWNTSRIKSKEILQGITSMIRYYFPNTSAIPVLGNHDSHPINSFTPPAVTSSEYSSSWLYNAAADAWSIWLPQRAVDTFRYFGSYTVRVVPGLRVIALNTNICYIMNWWVLYDSSDPGGLLKWLANELLLAEQAGDKVHIIGHVAPSYDCYRAWDAQYTRILERFRSTVVEQFYGHTHYDEFRLLFSRTNTDRVTLSAYVAPSQTPFTKLNVGYRIYSIDGFSESPTFRVIDHETWVFNLTEANMNPSVYPRWYLLYTLRSAFKMASLLPRNFKDLFNTLVTNDTVFKEFYRYYVKDADAALKEGCDAKCRKLVLCQIVVTVANETDICEDVRGQQLGAIKYVSDAPKMWHLSDLLG